MTERDDIVLAAIRNLSAGDRQVTRPVLRDATGVDYAELELILHRLEFKELAIDKHEGVNFTSYSPATKQMGHIDVSKEPEVAKSNGHVPKKSDISPGITNSVCGCGRPEDHKGRCSWRRGNTKNVAARPGRIVDPVAVSGIDAVDVDFFMGAYEKLIEILDADMDDAEQSAVWVLVRYLKRVEKSHLEALALEE